MTPMRFSGPVLPDGEVRDLYVVGDTVTYEPQAGADTAAEGWIVPGLVDAHCHIGLDDHGAVDDADAEAQAIEDRDAGALLIRDCGSAADTSWVHDRDDLPRLIRAGRHIARTRRYIRNYAHEVEPPSLVETVAQEAQRGDGWVKLVGRLDLPRRGRPRAVLPGGGLRRRDRRRARTRRQGDRALLRRGGAAGADRGRHRLHRARHRAVDRPGADDGRAQGIALVPTVMQIDKFPQYADAGRDKFPQYADHMTDLHARQRDTIMAAHELGVALYAGSDGGGVSRHGNIAGEVIAMHGLGMPADYALGAASWRARDWLGWNATLDEGAPADFVVYPRDPLLDLTVLLEPSYVVLRDGGGRVMTTIGDVFPVLDLRVTAGDLELRGITDDDLVTLGALAARGVHPPDRMPFSFPWTDVSAEELPLKFAQYHWRTRADFAPDAWVLNLGVWSRGELVGVQGVTTKNFVVRRTGETGSWLGIAHQGHGIGTAMRQVMCVLLFDHLGFTEITSGAFADNPASLAVSRKVGYRVNGTERFERRGELVEMTMLTLSPDDLVRPTCPSRSPVPSGCDG